MRLIRLFPQHRALTRVHRPPKAGVNALIDEPCGNPERAGMTRDLSPRYPGPDKNRRAQQCRTDSLTSPIFVGARRGAERIVGGCTILVCSVRRNGLGGSARGLLCRRRTAIWLVTIAARFADERRRYLELVQRLGLVLVVVRNLAEVGEPGFEVALVFPDLG